MINTKFRIALTFEKTGKWWGRDGEQKHIVDKLLLFEFLS